MALNLGGVESPLFDNNVAGDGDVGTHLGNRLIQVKPIYLNTGQNSTAEQTAVGPNWTDVNGLAHTFIIDTPGTVLVLASMKCRMQPDVKPAEIHMKIVVDDVEVTESIRIFREDFYVEVGGAAVVPSDVDRSVTTHTLARLTEGTHTIKIQAKSHSGAGADIDHIRNREMDIIVFA